MSDGPIVLLVGHCVPDSFGLTRLVESAGASAVRVNSERDLRDRLGAAAALLVNRALDGRFPDKDGIELIRRLAGEGVATPMLLVSNYPEAQQAATAAGALPGFGKRELSRPETSEKLRAAIAARAGVSREPGE